MQQKRESNSSRADARAVLIVIAKRASSILAILLLLCTLILLLLLMVFRGLVIDGTEQYVNSALNMLMMPVYLHTFLQFYTFDYRNTYTTKPPVKP